MPTIQLVYAFTPVLMISVYAEHMETIKPIPVFKDALMEHMGIPKPLIGIV